MDFLVPGLGSQAHDFGRRVFRLGTELRFSMSELNFLAGFITYTKGCEPQVFFCYLVDLRLASNLVGSDTALRAESSRKCDTDP